MQESTCKHCGKTIYRDEEDPVPDRREFWSSNKIWYEIWCGHIGWERHEPIPETSLGEKKALLAAKEIMHRDLMREIEDLRREIAQEELQAYLGDLRTEMNDGGNT